MKKISYTLSSESIVSVRFTETGDTHLFGSLSAIYELFTAEEIGCPLESLWHRGVLDGGRRFSTGKCEIARVPVYRKRNKNSRTNKS